MAYTDYSESEWENLKKTHNNFATEADRTAAESGLVMVSIFGLMDPLRPGIRQAVE